MIRLTSYTNNKFFLSKFKFEINDKHHLFQTETHSRQNRHVSLALSSRLSVWKVERLEIKLIFQIKRMVNAHVCF